MAASALLTASRRTWACAAQPLLRASNRVTAAAAPRRFATTTRLPDTVIVTRELPEPGAARLAAAQADGVVRVHQWPHAETPMPAGELLAACEEARAAGSDVAGLLVMLSDSVSADVMKACGDQLRVVSTLSVGYNHIDIAEASRRGVAVGYTPGYLDSTTAELAMALILASLRRVVETAAEVPSGRWGAWSPLQYCGTDLSGSTVGIVGLGAIGTAVGRMLSGFGCRILYSAPREKAAAASGIGAEWVPFETLLEQSDIITLHCPLTADTANLFDAAAFARMKPTATLVNTSRGDVVDQEALVEALTTGQIASAGLDVTVPEPLPVDHPLVHLPNCTITPHIGSATTATRMAMADAAVTNLLNGVAGTPLKHRVGGN